MSRVPEELLAKWSQIVQLPYAGQAKWMLNGFWAKVEPDTELVWTWCHTFIRLDETKRADGCDLDEFLSHKFLETLGQTMTVIEMREKFRQIDADFNKRISLVEYIMFRYGFSVAQVVNAPQGENKEQIAKAQAMIDAAQVALDEVTVRLEASKVAAQRAKEASARADQAARDARAAAEEAKKKKEASWFAEQENKKALEVLHEQERAYEGRKAELAKTKDDASIGVVKRNKAANELEQLLAEDPLPLRMAKINQQATVNKSEKARKAAEEAQARAEQEASRAAEAAEAAKQAVVAAEEAARQVELAVAEAEAKLQEAHDYMEQVKLAGGVAQGDIWWMQRELTEKKKYLPRSKQ